MHRHAAADDIRLHQVSVRKPVPAFGKVVFAHLQHLPQKFAVARAPYGIAAT
jgi:hypothetical protein